MTREVVIFGFPGVQALDLVGPHDVFTGAAQLTDGGYQVSVVSIDGQPAATPTGLAFVTSALPKPQAVDTLVLPGGEGVDAARRGQTQFAAPVWMPRAKRQPIRDAQDAIEAEPGAGHSITDLARRAAMSPRHFTRVFTDEIGEAPGSYVERVRTEAARRQLEETDDTVVAIAARCGFGTAESLRRNFIRRIGVSPDQYRKRFA